MERRRPRHELFMVFVFGLLSRKIIRHARRRGVEYSFLFMHPDGTQLAEISVERGSSGGDCDGD
jgi:hypothetical protein